MLIKELEITRDLKLNGSRDQSYFFQKLRFIFRNILFVWLDGVNIRVSSETTRETNIFFCRKFAFICRKIKQNFYAIFGEIVACFFLTKSRIIFAPFREKKRKFSFAENLKLNMSLH